jgi:hypothetical protein
MSRYLLKLVLLTPLLFVAADPKPPDSNPLQVGKNVPATLNAYNVTGPHGVKIDDKGVVQPGKYHCLITEHNLDPTILVFVRNFTAPEALAAVKPLLTVIDDRIDKNFTRVRLSSYAVFFNDELTDVLGVTGTAKENDANDDLREKLQQSLLDMANADPKLNYVVLALDDKNDLKKFALDESKFVTVVLFKKLQIVAVFALTKNELNEAKIAEISGAITDKLGATRK